MAAVFNFLGGYIASHLLDGFLSLTNAGLNAQAERVKNRQNQLMNQGHSQVCASATAADEENMLDSDVRTIIRFGGGCKKCGI